MPQVINIIKGEMSLVGPRPERQVLLEEFNRQICGFSRRLRVRPGVAGLAQVRGDALTNPRCKLRYDNLYIERMSPWMDLQAPHPLGLACPHWQAKDTHRIIEPALHPAMSLPPPVIPA